MEQLKKRLSELSERCIAKNIHTFSDFLSESQQAEVSQMAFFAPTMWSGGSEFAVRKMIRFGKDCNGKEDFPISILHIFPKSKKFAVDISHRDVLGGVMNQGVAREKVGDIFISGSDCYVVVARSICNHIVENLSQISRNSVGIEEVLEIPTTCKQKTEEVRISVASERVDAVVAKLLGLSRERCLELFKTQRVMISGRICENNSQKLVGGESISLRGFGKYRYIETFGTSKKGKLYVSLEKFV